MRDDKMPIQHMKIRPKGMLRAKTVTPIIFFIISNLRKRSERPFTFNKFMLMACTGYHIEVKQIGIVNVAAKSHFSPIRKVISGWDIPANKHMIGKIIKAERRNN